MSMNMTFPRTTLRKPYMAAGGALVPQELGTRVACKTIYVDQVNGLNTNNGREWGAAKQTVFGATGGLAAMADGDMMVIRPGHAEGIVGVNAIALNFCKFVVEGGRKVAYANALVVFPGVGSSINVQGTNNEFYRFHAVAWTVSGPSNCFIECSSSSNATGWTISSVFNYFERGDFGSVNPNPGAIVSASQNWFENCDFVGGNGVGISFTNNCQLNVVNRPKNPTVAVQNFAFAAGTNMNMIFDVELGIGATSFMVTDIGTNYVYPSARSSSRLREAIFPVGAGAVNVIGGAGAWAWGVLSPFALGIAYDYEFVGIQAILNMVDEYEIEVSDAAGNILGNFTLNNAAIGTRFNEKLATPVRIRATVGISARLRTLGGGNDTADMRIKYRV